MNRNQRRQHATRKAAAARKEAARYRDGQGKHRVTVSRANAAMRRAA
jgi:hypothetical protein